jgi:N-ethylmaleimide reductase
MAPTSVVEAVRPQQAVAELLFQPYRLGPFTLPHRIVMAPLTRSRARQPGNVPTSLNACYYAQRASAAFIISEATQVSMQGQGYAWTPGIHSREQVEGWRLVTDAVHAAGGRIFLQLWHVGRISHPALQPDHMLPVAPRPLPRPATRSSRMIGAKVNWCRSFGRGRCRSRRCLTSLSNMRVGRETPWPPISTG